MGLTNDPTCKSLILLVSGYNLKVRGSNPLLATNPFPYYISVEENRFRNSFFCTFPIEFRGRVSSRKYFFGCTRDRKWFLLSPGAFMAYLMGFLSVSNSVSNAKKVIQKSK